MTLEDIKGAVQEREVGPAGFLPPYRPTQKEVEALIARAQIHPLGLDFLKNSALETAAITFGVHVFAVESARQRLG